MVDQELQMQRFNPNEHLIQLKSRDGSKDYLPVQWRLVWFRNECADGTIETELVHLDLDIETEEEAFAWNPEKRKSEKVMKIARGIAIFRATVKDGKGGVATGTKMEKAASFPDFLEKAETGAIGRALAALGYGTQFAPELNETHRIVDSPVEGSSRTNSTTSNSSDQMRSSNTEHQNAVQSQPNQRATAAQPKAQNKQNQKSSQEGVTEQEQSQQIAAISPTMARSINAYNYYAKNGYITGESSPVLHENFYKLSRKIIGRDIVKLQDFTEQDLQSLEDYVRTHKPEANSPTDAKTIAQ